MTTEAPIMTGLAERERVIAVLRTFEPELRALGVTRLALFGSLARGEADARSDVDLLALIDPRARFSLIDLIALEERLADRLGRPVDISTAPWKMRPAMRARVDAERIELF